MPSTHKKVIVRKLGRDSLSGYVSPAQFVVEGKLELLNPSGKVVLVDLAEIKSAIKTNRRSRTGIFCKPE